MDWDFTENIAFKTLYDAFKVSGESSALEFLSSEGASYYLELTQDAAGEGIDLGDNETMEQLHPEQSTTAIISLHSKAKYFSA